MPSCFMPSKACRQEDEFRLRADALKAAITPRTKLVIMPCLLYTSKMLQGCDVLHPLRRGDLLIFAGAAVVVVQPHQVGVDPVSYTHLDVYKRQV